MFVFSCITVLASNYLIQQMLSSIVVDDDDDNDQGRPVSALGDA